MATLYRPKLTTYTLKDGSYRTPDGRRVTKDTPGAVRKVSRSKTWFGRYTDGNGQQHQGKLSASKETARRMLAKLADRREGLHPLAGPRGPHPGRPPGLPGPPEPRRPFDFHAPRGQFIGLLAAAGVHAKVAQVLARHSTITPTMDYYTRLDVFDVGGALEKLPPVAGAKPA